MAGTRPVCVAAVTAALALLAACGGDDPATSAAPGTPENPLVAKTGGGSEPAAPAYDALVDQQSRQPGSTFTPCNLVTRTQAGQIMGAELKEPIEAPQGPTCVYQTRSGSDLVTISVQSVAIGRLKGQLRRTQQVAVGGRTAFCGLHGQPMLYLPLPHGGVLAIAGQCATAKRFAASALRRL